MREPPLSYSAKQMLALSGGEERFRVAYGDYYVAGFTLGGEAGAFMSVNTDAMTKVEQQVVTESVKGWFSTKSHTEVKMDRSHVEHLNFTFSGYDTLEGLTETHQPVKGSSPQLQNACSVFLEKTSILEIRLLQASRSLGLKTGHPLPLADCGKVCRSGLVVQLLLVPFKWLRDYQVAHLRV